MAVGAGCDPSLGVGVGRPTATNPECSASYIFQCHMGRGGQQNRWELVLSLGEDQGLRRRQKEGGDLSELGRCCACCLPHPGRFRLEFQCLARCNPYPTRVPLWLESPLRPSHTVIPIWSPPLLALLLQSSLLLL